MPKDQYLVMVLNLFIFINLVKFWKDETKLMLARRRGHESLL
mgnify:CR=1 FL=1